MAFTRTWNVAYEALPADTDPASQGANRIRDFKTDIKERVAIDHSMAGDADDGKHLQITFKDPLSAKPTAAASEGYLYTKDVSTKAELFWEDEDGNELQLTSGGSFSLFPSGTKMVFYQAAAPSGWTQVTTADVNNAMLRVVNTSGGGNGGSDSPILMDKVPSHTHPASTDTVGNHKHDVDVNSTGVNGTTTAVCTATTIVAGDQTPDYMSLAGDHSHTVTVSANSGAANWTPKYVDMIVCTKD